VIRRWFVRVSLIAAVATLAANAQQKPPKPSAKPAESAAPAEAPPLDEEPAGELPAGHPPVENPHGRGEGRGVIPDRNEPDKALPVGTIEATLVDEKENPLAGVEVRLGILRQTIAEGESRTSRTAVTNQNGKVRFDGLEGGTKFSYRISTKKDVAEYASSPFNLPEKSGQNVLLHVYPVTSDIQAAQIGMRGMMVVDPRDDAFQFEVMFQVFNVGAVSWVPDRVVMDLPKGYRAFSSEESMNDTRVVEETGRGVKMLGTYSPGQHQLMYRFQVPSDEKESAEFVVSLPPHVAELRVMVPAARNMQLDVQGFASAEPQVGQDGRRLLVVSRQLRPGEPEMKDVVIRLSGIPTPGSGRWYAVAIALTVILGGVFLTARAESSLGSTNAKDGERAQKLLLAELVRLERAMSAGEIGPRTYERARSALLDALTRLEARLPKKQLRERRRLAKAR
jgi:hypothetical protein